MKYLVSFGRFWWDFVVGDDWLVAAAVLVVLGLTALLAHRQLNPWWLLPPTILGLLSLSLLRAIRRAQ